MPSEPLSIKIALTPRFQADDVGYLEAVKSLL